MGNGSAVVKACWSCLATMAPSNNEWNVCLIQPLIPEEISSYFLLTSKPGSSGSTASTTNFRDTKIAPTLLITGKLHISMQVDISMWWCIDYRERAVSPSDKEEEGGNKINNIVEMRVSQQKPLTSSQDGIPSIWLLSIQYGFYYFLYFPF